jgi:Holliday junction resolvase RusA-like endonuclease
MSNILFDFMLPIKPVSNNDVTADVNHKYSKNKIIRIKTTAYHNFQRSFGLLAMAGRVIPEDPISEKVNLTIFLDFKDTRPRDLANYEKAITDTLVKNRILSDDNNHIIVSNTQKNAQLTGDHYVRILIEKAH